MCKTLFTLCSEPARVRCLPFRLYLEPTTRCNLECRMCIKSISQRPQLDLSFDGFLRIMRHFPYLQDLQLQGIGEPLLNPDIFRMIEYAKAKRVRVGLFTNATLVDPEMAKRALNSGLDWINLSLDAASCDTYETIRKGARYEEVIENISAMMAIKKEITPAISIWFTAMMMNIQELPAIIRLAKRLGIGKVAVQGAHSWGNDFLRGYLKNDYLFKDIKLTRQAFIEATQEAKRLKVRLDFRPRYFQEGKKRVCRWPWVSCFITADGFVTPCCVQGSDPKILSFGNVFEEDFKVIWNSHLYQGFRRQLKSKNPPEICNDCPGYYYR